MKKSQPKHSVALGLPRGRGMAAATALAATVCAAYAVLLVVSGGIAGSAGVLDLAHVARSAGRVLFRPPSPAQTVHLAPGTSGVARPAERAALSIDLGRLPSATSISDAVHVTNSADVSRDMHVSVLGAPGVDATFAGTGGADQRVAPRATAAIALQASGTHAGPIRGQLRVTVAGSEQRPLTLPLSGAQAPLPVPHVEAKPLAGGRVAVDWTASPSTGVAGYQVFRASAKGRAVAVARTAATAVVDSPAEGSAVYEVRPIAAAVTPELLGASAAAAPTVADATPPAAPSAWSAPAVINAAQSSSVAVSVTLPTSSTPEDRVVLGVSDGEQQVRADETAGGATVSASFDLSSLADGPLHPFVVVTDAVGNSATYGASDAILKDTDAPAAPGGVSLQPGDAPDGVINAAGAGDVHVLVDASAGDTVVAELESGDAGVRADGPVGEPLHLDASSLPDGPLTLTAWVLDRAGNPSGHAVTSVTKDTQAPRTPDITTAADEDNRPGYVSAGSQHAAVVLLRFESPTNPQNRIVAQVAGTQVTAQGGPDQIALGPLDLSDQADGDIAVAGTITDAAGNVTRFDGTVVKDTVAPPAPLEAVALVPNAGTPPGKVRAEDLACVDVQVTLGEANASSDVVAVTLSQDGVEVDGQAPARDGDVSITCLDLSDMHPGLAQLHGSIRDAAGNVTDFDGTPLRILPPYDDAPADDAPAAPAE
jgi:hypothetical protein